MDAGVTGGVLELDVVAGLVLLDESVLQEQGLDLGVGDDEVHGFYSLHQRRGPGTVILFLKIIADPLLEVSGLADVDDIARICQYWRGYPGRGSIRADEGVNPASRERSCLRA